MHSKVRQFTGFFSAFYFCIIQGLLKKQNLKNDYIKHNIFIKLYNRKIYIASAHTFPAQTNVESLPFLKCHKKQMVLMRPAVQVSRSNLPKKTGQYTDSVAFRQVLTIRLKFGSVSASLP